MSSKCNILAELDKSQPQEGQGRAGKARRLQASRLVPNEEKWNLPCCNLQRQNVRQQQQAVGGEKQSQHQEQLPVHKQ